MLVPLRFYLVLGIFFAICSGGYYQVYQEIPLISNEDDQTRLSLAERWAQKVSLGLSELPGRPTVMVADVVNDTDGILTRELRRWISRRNVQVLRNGWVGDIGLMSGWSRSPASLQESTEPLLKQGADFVIAAEVLQWVTYPTYESSLAGRFTVCDGTTGEVLKDMELRFPDDVQVAFTNRDQRELAGITAATRIRNGARLGPGGSVTKDTERTKPAAINSAQASVADRGADAFGITFTEELQTGLRHQLGITSAWTGFGIWIVAIVAGPGLLKRQLRKRLRLRDNSANLRLLMHWAGGSLALAAVLWLTAVPGMLVLTAALLSTAAAVVMLGVYCHFWQQSDA